MNTQRNLRRRAFTLIEIVVALALGVVLIVGVQRIVVHSYHTSVELEGRAAHAAQRTLPFDLLTQDLQCVPTTGGLALSEGALTLTTLNAMQSQSIAARHAVVVTYVIAKTSGDSCQLQRRERGLDFADSDTPGVAVAEHLKAFDLALFDGQTWHTRWPLPTPRNALALRATVTNADGSRAERIIRLAPLRWRRHDE